MKLKFKDVLPNPYRDLKGNPPLRAKIEELKASIATTGFWDNVVVRKNKDGKYERAYGEHRVRAAMEAGLVEANFIVKELSDAMMIQIMDNENREVYSSSPASVIESVKAVVAALAEGTIPPFEVDPKTNAQHIRYAPSYVAGASSRTDASIPYTSTLIAQFLGRTYTNGRADTAVEAALNFLHLKELGAINNSVLVKDNQPITARKLFDITADLKKRTEAVQERRGKSAEEITKIREAQIALQKKQQAEEKKAEEERKALLQKLADAKRAENEKRADELKAKLKAEDKRAQEKDALNKLRAAELDEKLRKKKEWEAQQRVQDQYQPLRRDVDNFVSKYERLVSEGNPERDDIKALNRTLPGGIRLRPEDRARAQRAVREYINWLSDWALPQLAPELKAAQKRTAETRKVTQSRPKGKEAA